MLKPLPEVCSSRFSTPSRPVPSPTRPVASDRSLRVVSATSRTREEIIRDDFAGDYGAFLDDTLLRIGAAADKWNRLWVAERVAELRGAA